MQMKRCLQKSCSGRFVCLGLGLLVLGLWLLPWAAPYLSQDKTSGASVDTISLTGPEKAVVEHLRQDWTKQYRTTSIRLAAEVKRLRLSDDSRLRLVQFLESNRKSYPVVGRYGTTTVVLTPQEKLIGRTLLLREGHGNAGSKLEDVATDLQAPVHPLKMRLEFMQKLGVVLTKGEGKDLRYHLADRFPRRPSYRIDFQSHQVEVNGSDKFEVAWAIDFLLLVNSTHSQDTLKIEDSCAHCTQSISIIIERRRVKSILPSGALVFRGGGWGINNLFRSEEHLKKWLQRYPEFADRERMTVAEFLIRKEK